MPDTLTPSEVRCLRLAGQELSNKAIARKLGVSDKTVSNHLTSAYAKLGVTTLGQAKRREAALLVARHYPDISQLSPTPIVQAAQPPFGQEALSDDVMRGTGATVARWILPAPPRGLVHLLGIILALAAVAGVVTIGLVQLAAGGMTTLAAAAPPNAASALDSTSSSRTK